MSSWRMDCNYSVINNLLITFRCCFEMYCCLNWDNAEIIINYYVQDYLYYREIVINYI